MGTKVIRRKMVECGAGLMKRIESWLPKGWVFLRAGYAVSEDQGEGVRIFFHHKGRPVSKGGPRRPRLRLLTMAQLKGLSPQVMALCAQGSDFGPSDVVVDCLLYEKEVRELFNLGDRVEIRGVRTHWEGGAKWKGKALGFSLRCVEPA